jgi:hypothetical protein
VYTAGADGQRKVKPRVDQQLGAVTVGLDSAQCFPGQAGEGAGGKIFFAQLYAVDSSLGGLSNAVEKPRPALDAVSGELIAVGDVVKQHRRSFKFSAASFK